MKYNRILIKLSGEALAGSLKTGWDNNILDKFAEEIKWFTENKIKIAIVIGGGNIFRGIKGFEKGIDRITGDYMGMTATVMNVLALNSILNKKNIAVCGYSSVKVGNFITEYNIHQALNDYNSGKVVILGGGLGIPYLTTDTTAALRALELNADILIKATKVNGVFDKDPEIDTTAKKIDSLTYEKVLKENLRVMDMTSIALCKDNNLPVAVLNVFTENELKNFVKGIATGSIIGG